MAAAWVKLEHPDLDVVVLGPPPERTSAARFLFRRMGREAFETVKPPLHRLISTGRAGPASKDTNVAGS